MPVCRQVQHAGGQPAIRRVDPALHRRERHAFAAQRHVAFALVQFGEPGVGVLFHGLVFRGVPDHRIAALLQGGVAQVQGVGQRGAPTLEAGFGEVAHELAGFGEDLRAGVAVSGSVADQGGVAAGDREDMRARTGSRLRDNAAETFRTLVAGIEANVLFDVAVEFDPMFLEVADAGHRINREDLHRNAFQSIVIEHGIGQHMATYTASTPADQVDLSGNNAVLAERFNDLLLQLLLGHAAFSVVVFTPKPGAFDFYIFNGNTGRFETVVFRFGQLLALPVALAFDDVHCVLHVFLPALAEQRAAETVVGRFGEQLIGLQITGAGAVDDNPFGELAASVVRSESGHQLTVPIVAVAGVELGGTRAAKENSQCTHNVALE